MSAKRTLAADRREQQPERRAPVSVWTRRDTSIFLAVAGIVAVASSIWIYAVRPNILPIHSDGTAYYVYLPEILLRHDPSFEKIKTVDTRQESIMLRLHKDPRTGRYVDKTQVGEAVLLLPFFAAGHAAAIVMGSPRTGFSTPYEVAAAAAGIAYLLIGLAFLFELLSERFSRAAVFWSGAAVLFGAPLFHFATFDGTFSHVYSFTVFAFLLVVARRWVRSPSWLSTIGLGVGAGLLLLIRATNVILLLCVVVYATYELSKAGGLGRELWRRRSFVGAGAVLTAAAFTPQLLLWRIATGRWVINSYAEGTADNRFIWGHPHILQVLIQANQVWYRPGRFYWSPIMLLAAVGLIFLVRRDPGMAYGSAITLALFTLVTASWATWWVAHRVFVETLPLVALGFAALVQTLRGPARRVILFVSAASIVISMTSVPRYWFSVYK